MADWKEYKLGDLVEITSSKRIMRSDYISMGVPFFRSKEIIELNQGNQISTELFISDEKYNEIKSKFGVPSEGDILLTSVGTLGVPYLVKENDRFYFKDGNLTWFRKFSENLNSKFLFYWISSEIGRSKLDKITIGSTQKALTIIGLKSLDIKIPSIEEQLRIVKILDSLSNKITLNTQINQTLEAITQAIFKSWFIDFDPVRAKAQALSDGKTAFDANLAAMAVISGKAVEDLNETEYQQLYEIAATFPSELVESEEFGEVPLGWESVSIADKRILEIIKPKINKFDGEKDYIATANVSKNSVVGELEKITYEKRPSRANMQPIINSIWFAKMVGENKAILIDKDDKFLLDETVLSTGFMGLKPQKNIKSFLYCFINSEGFFKAKTLLATGAVQIALNNGAFSQIKIILPNQDVLGFFEKKIEIVFSKISSNQRENNELMKIRDLLLPRLLRGEIE